MPFSLLSPFANDSNWEEERNKRILEVKISVKASDQIMQMREQKGLFDSPGNDKIADDLRASREVAMKSIAHAEGLVANPPKKKTFIKKCRRKIVRFAGKDDSEESDAEDCNVWIDRGETQARKYSQGISATTFHREPYESIYYTAHKKEFPSVQRKDVVVAPLLSSDSSLVKATPITGREAMSRTLDALSLEDGLGNGLEPDADSTYECTRDLFSLNAMVKDNIINAGPEDRGFSTQSRKDVLKLDFTSLVDSSLKLTNYYITTASLFRPIIRDFDNACKQLVKIITDDFETKEEAIKADEDLVSVFVGWRQKLNDIKNDEDSYQKGRDIWNQRELRVLEEMNPFLQKLTGKSLRCVSEDGSVSIKKDLLDYDTVSNVIREALNVRVIGSGTLPTVGDAMGGGFAYTRPVELEEEIHFEWPTVQGDKSNVCSTKMVAVKTVRDGDFDENFKAIRMTRELKVWRELKHANIVPLLGVWLKPNSMRCPALVSPLISGGTLWDYIGKKGRTTGNMVQRLTFMRDIASGLLYLHTRTPHVVHADLKPDNVLLHGDRAVLVDFGLSRLFDGIRGLTTSTTGCWRFTPPEYLVSGDFEYTPNADMYMYGQTFYYLQSGEAPWSHLRYDSPAGDRFRKTGEHAQTEKFCIEEAQWEFMQHFWLVEGKRRPTAADAVKEMDRFITELK